MRVIAGSGFGDDGALSLNQAMKPDISIGTVSDGGASKCIEIDSSPPTARPELVEGLSFLSNGLE